MATSTLDPARRQFCERILVQLRSRYPAWKFGGADDGFAIVAQRERTRVTFALTTLYQRTIRPGAAVPEEIIRFVAAAAPRLSAAASAVASEPELLDPEALVWCVRTERVIRRYPRQAELVTRPLPGGLIAFAAEALPGEVMRGVSRNDAAALGISEAELAERCQRNTELRLQSWMQQLQTTPSRGRWLFSDDILFSSSLLVVRPFLAAVAALGGGQAALLAPDRGTLVAAVGEAANPAALRHISRRLYGRAVSPLIPYLLLTDGRDLALHPSETARRRPWSGWRQVLGLREP